MKKHTTNHLTQPAVLFLKFMELLFLLLIYVGGDLFPSGLEERTRIACVILWSLMLLEILFAYAVLRRKTGFIGIPVSILFGYWYFILERAPGCWPSWLFGAGAASILLHAVEAWYLYRRTEHERGMEEINKLLCFSVMLDAVNLAKVWTM